MIFGYKVIMRSKRVRSERADLFKGKDKIDKEEEEFLARQAAGNQKNKKGSWLYKHFLGWLF